VIRNSFNDDWRVRPKMNHFLELLGGGNQPWEAVTLPHDAMVGGRAILTGIGARASSRVASGSTRRRSWPVTNCAAKRVLLDVRAVARERPVHPVARSRPGSAPPMTLVR
jgi:hypothetical protein